MALSKVRKVRKDASVNDMFDALVVFDERYSETKDFLHPFQQLQNKYDLKLTYVYEGMAPGESFVTSVSKKKENAKFVVLYITEHYCSSDFMIQIAETLARTKKLICLLKNDKNIILHERLYFLSWKIFYETDMEWQSILSRQLKKGSACYPSFCKSITYKTYSQNLHQNGLSLSTIKWDMLGVTVQMDERVLTIDLDIFAEHVQDHEKYETHQVCSTCSDLCTLQTSVAFKVKNLQAVSDIEEFSVAFVKLSSSVIDVIEGYHERTIWTVLCSLKGGALADSDLIRYLSSNVYYALAGKCIHYLSGTYCYPEFLSLQSRKNSFLGNWSQNKRPTADQMAEAGLFYNEYFEAPVCFHCRSHQFKWDEEIDPLVQHALICPFCPYVTSQLTYERLKNAISSQEKRETSVVYDNLEQRIQSFRKFDVRHVVNYENIKQQDKIVTIRQIAEAGFHYLGLADMISCSSCGLLLSSYEVDEDLIFLHIKLSPKCKFVLQEKGVQIVNTVLDMANFEAKSRGEETRIQFHVRTLDKHPRRDFPRNSFKPAFDFEK